MFTFFLDQTVFTAETVLFSLFRSLLWCLFLLSLLVLDPDFTGDKRALAGQIILAIIIICFFIFLNKELIIKDFTSFLLEFILLIFACWFFIRFPRLWKKIMGQKEK
jgi:hypothetical protein